MLRLLQHSSDESSLLYCNNLNTKRRRLKTPHILIKSKTSKAGHCMMHAVICRGGHVLDYHMDSIVAEPSDIIPWEHQHLLRTVLVKFNIVELSGMNGFQSDLCSEHKAPVHW